MTSMSQFKRQGSGVNGFLQGMSVGQSKSGSVAARRAEFERMKGSKQNNVSSKKKGTKNAHYLDKEAQKKLGEAGTYKEWTIVYDPQSGENYYYNNFSGACVGRARRLQNINTKRQTNRRNQAMGGETNASDLSRQKGENECTI